MFYLVPVPPDITLHTAPRLVNLKIVIEDQYLNVPINVLKTSITGHAEGLIWRV